MAAVDSRTRGSRWGDRDGDESTGVEDGEEKGIRTIVEFHTDEQGRKIKMIRRVRTQKKVAKVNKKVLERRHWKKFGDCAGLPPGPEQNITYTVAEPIKLELSDKAKKEEEDDNPIRNLSEIVCRHCGEKGHWTLRCPQRNLIEARGVPPAEASRLSPRESTPTTTAGATASSGKYIPPSQRRGATGAPGERKSTFDDSLPTLRVSNISEDTTEADLGDLFRQFGHTQRIYLAKDRVTGASRGFAFVTFHQREDAAAALLKLDGHGYDNLILRVEWAKPREREDK